MNIKYAVALMRGDKETILGVFNTKDEADYYGMNNKVSHAAGLQYCFSSNFSGGMPDGTNIKVYNFYNV